MKTAREVLDVLDTLLANEEVDGGLSRPEAQRLWDVLTALRGPDHMDLENEKVYTTAPIRGASFPKLLKGSYKTTMSGGSQVTRQGMDINQPSKFRWPGVDTYSGPRNTHGHFRNHIKNAAGALGLVDDPLQFDGSKVVTKW